MPLFVQYRLTEYSGRANAVFTLKAGLLMVLVSGLLLLATPVRGPGLWCAFGLALGLQLLLWGAFKRQSTSLETDRAAGQKPRGSEDAFPFLLFGVQTLFTFIAIALGWLTICGLEIPTTAWRHVNVALLTIMIPAYRLSSEFERTTESFGSAVLKELFRTLSFIFITTFVFGLLMALTIPPTKNVPEESLIYYISAWVVLIIIICAYAILFISHVSHLRAQRP